MIIITTGVTPSSDNSRYYILTNRLMALIDV